LSLVPSALKQRVYDQTKGNKLKQVLSPTVNSNWYSANDLPTGLKHYIANNPNQFKSYFNERRHELGLMKAVLQNLTPTQKQTLRQHYEEQKQMTAKDFQAMISPPTVKSKRTKRKKVTGGCDGCEYASGCTTCEYSDDEWDNQSSITEILG